MSPLGTEPEIRDHTPLHDMPSGTGTAANILALYDLAKAADPLRLDGYFRQSGPVVRQGINELLDRLAVIVRDAATTELDSPSLALAALRDIDFLLCAAHLARPSCYKEVPGLEILLVNLGRIAGHIPRGSNITYALCNPTDDRIRVFTGLPEEIVFVRELELGLRRLDDVLHGLNALACHSVDSLAAAAAARTLQPAWEPMIGAAVAMLREMPPEVFSRQIMTCFVTLDIAGKQYQGVTGAQNLNIGIDYLLWGVESQDPYYLSYARTNLGEQLPPHRELIARTMRETGHVSLLTHLERQLRNGRVRDRDLAETVLLDLESLLRRIGTFRAAHRRLADLNLPYRPTPTGSGGHTVDLLEMLALATIDARQRVRGIRAAGWGPDSQNGGDPARRARNRGDEATRGDTMTDLDPEEFRRLGHAFVNWVADYRAGLPDQPVRPDVAPGTVRAQLGELLPEQPQPLDTLLDDVDRVVVPATLHWQHPSFFGYFPANASLASILGDLLSGGLGGQGMLWSTAPAGTEVEQALLDRLAESIGLDPEFTFDGGGGGTITDSASSAALAVLLAALHRTSGGSWREDGVDGRERVYVTAETHSSLAKAVRVAGLGRRALRTVPVSPGSLSMSPAALDAMLRADVAAGLRPVLVCATVGTTGTGAIDPVAAIAPIARSHGAWVHVDAAWAGVAALCPEHRYLLDGVDLADSFCTNPHKWLLTAFDTSLLWVRDAAALPAALSIVPEYLRNAASESGEVVDYRDWQVPLGRRFRALKLWAVLHAYGLSGLRAHIRHHIGLAEELVARIQAEPGFALAAPPSLALVCLRLDTGNPVADDDATRTLLETVNATGKAFLTHTVTGGRYAIRVAIGGVTTGLVHLDALWDELRGTARMLRSHPLAS